MLINFICASYEVLYSNIFQRTSFMSICLPLVILVTAHFILIIRPKVIFIFLNYERISLFFQWDCVATKLYDGDVIS